MAIEHALARLVPKPWGVLDLQPWSTNDHHGQVIGEVWYERRNEVACVPSLRLKLLFTSQPLSIQVHPNDTDAQSMGLLSGKNEAWYILRAARGAKVALGLKQRLAPRQLRAAIDDGSIAGLVAWQTVAANDVVSVSAGTIHAIGAGLVIAEIQQRSDVTFRLFDFGRERELHAESAIAVSDAGPADVGVQTKRLTDQRTMLISNPHFAFERIDLPQNTSWRLRAERETWLLIVGGSARVGHFDVSTGAAVFAESDEVEISVGHLGMVALIASAGFDQSPQIIECGSLRDTTRAEQHPVLPAATSKRADANPTIERPGHHQ
jgi:mannose-6-phosphate isomerase